MQQDFIKPMSSSKNRRVMALILHEILDCTENIPLPIS